jgi:hypothetical protein
VASRAAIWHFFAFEIGFDWVCIGFVLGLFWHFIGFNWLCIGFDWV